jgi:hypothetical protein
MRSGNSVARLTLLALAVCATNKAQFFRKNYALVIAVDRYRDSSWAQLSSAQKGAEAVARFLSAHGYEVASLYNDRATKTGILAGLDRLARLSGPDDRALVYFAGHGYTVSLPAADEGFLVPFNGTTSERTLVSMRELGQRSARIRARHQLYLVDSCYSGLAWTGGVKANHLDPTHIQMLAAGKARQVITAGRKDQRVTDTGPDGYSLFTGALLRGLAGRADLNKDGYITVSELGAYLDTCGSNRFQNPTIGSLRGQTNGEFFFEIGKSIEGSSPGADCGFERSRSAAQQYTACDLNHNGLLDSIDMDEMIGEALGTLPCKDSLTGTGTCTVVDVQRVINAVLTGTCRVGP